MTKQKLFPFTKSQPRPDAMQVEAVYDHGRIELTRSLRLRHPRVRVIIDIPDDEILGLGPVADPLPPEVLALAEEMRARLDSVRNAPIPPEDELPAVTEKSRTRLAAFALRPDP